MGYGNVTPGNLVGSKMGGKFGLNQGTLVSFDLVQDEKNHNSKYVHLVIKIGEREYNKRYYEPNKIWHENQEIGIEHELYASKKDAAEEEFSKTIVSIVEAFVPLQTIEQTLRTGVTGFDSFVTKMTNLVNTSINKNIDVFLQWQKVAVNGTQYLEIPSSCKHGYFVAPHTGEFVEKKTNDNLTYVNDKGEQHKFTRTEWFMEQSGWGKKMDIPEVSRSTPDALPPSDDPFSI